MKKYRYFILAFSILLLVLLTIMISKPILVFMSEPEAFQEWVSSKGFFGVILFVIMNIVQVLLSIIPGGPFEIGAGYAFGILKGTLLCDFAMTIGSAITFLLARRFGYRFIELFIEKEKLQSIKILKTSRKSTHLLFLFFLIPGTPKDLMSYVVGVTDLPLRTWIIINFFGRFPAILLSAMSGSALGSHRYSVFLFTMAAILIFYMLGIGVRKLWLEKKRH